MKIGVRYLLERSIVHMVKEKSPLQGSVVTLDHQKLKCRLIIVGKKRENNLIQIKIPEKYRTYIIGAS